MSDPAKLLRDWLHETPLTLCDQGSDTCGDWDLANALAEALREQGGPLGELAWERLLDQTRLTAERLAR
jgi:hypothetical protein